MFARFFVDRPIFATVLSIVIVIIGLVALQTLPIAQYPEVVPPTVNISATYPGASAKVVADTVAAPIEQEVNGVENMLHMLSKSTNDGQMNLDVTFRVGTNLDFAQVLTQNRVSIAEAKLPDEVKRQGVTVKKKSPMILLCVNLLSPGKRYDQLYLSNYATIQVKDALARLPGVGDVSFLVGRDELRHRQLPRRPGIGDDGRVPGAGGQRDRDRGERPRRDGTAEGALPRGHGVQDRLRHDGLRRRVDPRGLQDALRGVRPRLH